MGESMVERVAQSIEEIMPAWPGEADAKSEIARHYARAAIEAMEMASATDTAPRVGTNARMVGITNLYDEALRRRPRSVRDWLAATLLQWAYVASPVVVGLLGMSTAWSEGWRQVYPPEPRQ